MALQFFNTLTRRKEEFVPLNPPHVGLYTCGPTVYNYAHIGNLRAFMFEDLLRRYLEYKGFQVKHVMNITDVEDKTFALSANPVSRCVRQLISTRRNSSATSTR